ncbi:MAG TPA: hypothetical protein VEA44_14870 [Caulobacter sp.]|nr:hypothetical protein [Caulobacter sp.]
MTVEDMERERLLRPYLRPDERLVWTGQPQPGLVLTGQDIFLIPFSLLWGGFVLFWEATVLASGGPSVMALFGVPFVLIGLFMIFGRFLVDAVIRRGMVYGLTDRRAIVLRRTFGESVSTTALSDDIGLDRHGPRHGPVRAPSLHVQLRRKHGLEHLDPQSVAGSLFPSHP